MERLIKVSEVASVLACSEDRVYSLARWKIIPSVKIGRSIRFNPLAIQEFIEDGGRELTR